MVLRVTIVAHAARRSRHSRRQRGCCLLERAPGWRGAGGAGGEALAGEAAGAELVGAEVAGAVAEAVVEAFPASAIGRRADSVGIAE